MAEHPTPQQLREIQVGRERERELIAEAEEAACLTQGVVSVQPHSRQACTGFSVGWFFRDGFILFSLPGPDGIGKIFCFQSLKRAFLTECAWEESIRQPWADAELMREKLRELLVADDRYGELQAVASAGLRVQEAVRALIVAEEGKP